MATNKNARAMCDICGFVYAHRVMKLNSYGMLVCPTDWDGAYDFKNHPQNKVPRVGDDITIRNARPDTGGRDLNWEEANFNWDEDIVRFWSNV